MRGAMARAAMCADAQIGAPAQAMTCRRGSSARTMKPRRSAAAVKVVADSRVRPMAMSARPGAIRTPCAPAACSSVGQLLQRRRFGMTEGEANSARVRTVAQRVEADCRFPLIPAQAGIAGRGSPLSRGRAEVKSNSLIDSRNGSISSAARTSRARASRPRCAMTSSRRMAASMQSDGMIAPSGIALARVAANAYT